MIAPSGAAQDAGPRAASRRRGARHPDNHGSARVASSAASTSVTRPRSVHANHGATEPCTFCSRARRAAHVRRCSDDCRARQPRAARRSLLRRGRWWLGCRPQRPPVMLVSVVTISAQPSLRGGRARCGLRRSAHPGRAPAGVRRPSGSARRSRVLDRGRRAPCSPGRAGRRSPKFHRRRPAARPAGQVPRWSTGRASVTGVPLVRTGCRYGRPGPFELPSVLGHRPPQCAAWRACGQPPVIARPGAHGRRARTAAPTPRRRAPLAIGRPGGCGPSRRSRGRAAASSARRRGGRPPRP